MRPLLALSDLHYTGTPPVCRRDRNNWMETLERKTAFIGGVARKHDVDVILVAGDVFDVPCPHVSVLIQVTRWWQKYLGDFNIVLVPGQHDLLNHNLGLLGKSAISVLDALPRVRVLLDNEVCFPGRDTPGGSWVVVGVPWGVEPKAPDIEISNDTCISPTIVALTHRMVWSTQKPYPSVEDSAQLEKQRELFHWADIVVSGDNHQRFIHINNRNNPRLWVNPGSFYRRSADQIGFQPQCVLIRGVPPNADVETINIPIDPDAVSRDHLDEAKADERIETFVSSLQSRIEGPKLDFKEVVEQMTKLPSVSEGVRGWMLKAIGAGNA